MNYPEIKNTDLDIDPGIYHDVPAPAYHAANNWLGSTSIKRWVAEDCTPRQWMWERDYPKDPTAAMSLGDAIHTALLEPEHYDARYVVYDGVRNKRHKAYAEFLDSLAGETVLTPREDAIARDCARYVREEASGVYTILRSGNSEVSGFWRDPETGLSLKFRADYIGQAAGRTVVLDVKTTADVSLKARRNKLAQSKLGGPIAVQAAMYMDGVEACTGVRPDAFYILWVRTEGAVDVILDSIAPSALEWGHAKYRRALGEIAKHNESNSWPGFPRRIEELTLPTWATTEDSDGD